MAQRRMFSLKVIDTDSFLDMSPTAQNLYFHLGMRADDDGFVSSPKKIMKMVSAPDDDMRVLVAKGFIVPMATSGVCVISHWKMNNLIKSDRYTETIYLEEKARLKEENGVYTVDILGSKMVPVTEPQVRLGKDRIGKDNNTSETVAPQVSEVIKLFEDINPAVAKMYGNKTQRASCQRMLEKYGIEKIQQLVAVLPKTNTMKYAPTITTPLQLEDKMAQLVAFIQKEQSNQIIF